jgi:methylmalonyl-CoA mutase
MWPTTKPTATPLFSLPFKGRAGGDGAGLKFPQTTARERRNVFELLVKAVKTHSLGQISHALYEVGGEYRRNM